MKSSSSVSLRVWVQNCVQANDSRKLVLLVQLVKRREMEEVKALMAAPESLDAALQRVRQQVTPHISPQLCSSYLTTPSVGLVAHPSICLLWSDECSITKSCCVSHVMINCPHL